MKRNGNERKPFSILFRGCSTLLVYETGVLAALKELSPNMLESASKIYGASSGSLIATFGLCGCDLEKMRMRFYNDLKTSFWGFHLGRRVINMVKEILDDLLPPNAHQLVAGRLHVIVTRMRDCRSVLVSEFASREELIQVLLCSCFIPFYFGLLPPMYRGVRYVDGEIGMWRSNFVSRATITVSAFAGEYDICPKDCSTAFLTFQFSDSVLQISNRNFSRFLYIFYCPTQQVLDQYYACGYQDTASYLKRLNEFGINYLDEDFMLPFTNESCQKGEETLHWKPGTRVLHSRATDPEDDTEESPGTSRAADEVEEEGPHHLHHQKAAHSEGSKCVPTSPKQEQPTSKGV
ncbi:omega-hydroxyceramide transacylase-like [Lathamus discolor]|uniref:omega-hydroxyceramide transacylase-like n=1 Tax=Lathamus discolor TaxID=678569 RepID=UPI0032B7385F